jgi:hypothetical protein
MSPRLYNAYKALNQFAAGYPYEVYHRLRSVGGSPPDTQFVLFARGRSGTTLFLSLLSSHPSITCGGEVLRRRVVAPGPLLQARAAQSPTSVYGCSLLSYQLQSIQTHLDRPKRLLEDLVDRGVTLFYLQRRNVLRHALSGLYAEHRRTWHDTGTSSSPPQRMRATRNDLFRWLDGSAQLRSFESSMLAGLPHESFTYEDDLQCADRHAHTAARAFTALGCAPVSPTTHLRRTTPRALEDFLTNAEQVRDWVRNSPYRPYLDALPA